MIPEFVVEELYSKFIVRKSDEDSPWTVMVELNEEASCNARFALDETETRNLHEFLGEILSER